MRPRELEIEVSYKVSLASLDIPEEILYKMEQEYKIAGSIQPDESERQQMLVDWIQGQKFEKRSYDWNCNILALTT